ncbi:MAG: hypothetical protein K1X85_09230 [Ignavibacteria bacterium]|nr:hypothetical protein [Ignavibacteria bacterium]
MTFRVGLRDIVLLPGLITVFLIVSFRYFAWVVDDLYIYFRYVENFVSGYGIVFNRGEHVEGFSSFLWFAWLALCRSAGADLETVAKYSSLSLAVLNILLVQILSLRILPGRLAIAAPVLTMFCLPYVIWAVSGFELMLFIFLLLLAVLILSNENSGAIALAGSAFVLFLLTVTRPEGILFAICLIYYALFTTGNRRRLRLPLLIYLTLTSVFFGFRLAYFGDVFPNTYYAKIGHGIFGDYEARSYKNGVLYFIFFLKDNPQFIPGLIFAFVVLIRYRSERLLMMLSLMLICQLAFITFAGGDWMVQHRFAVPAIPLLALLTAGLLAKLSRGRELAGAVTAALLCAVSAASLVFGDKSVIERETILWNNVKVVAPSMGSIIGPGKVAASGACGIIPYFLRDVTVIDMVGLTDRTIAKEGYRSGMWFERAMPEYVYSKDPQFLIMWKKKDENGVYRFKYAAPVYEEMSKDPGFEDFELAKSYDVLSDVVIEIYKRRDG